MVAARHQFLTSLALVPVFGVDEVVTGTLGISRVLLNPVSVSSAVGTLSVRVHLCYLIVTPLTLGVR